MRNYSTNKSYKKRKYSKIGLFFGLLIILGVIGFIGYSIFYNSNTVEEKIQNQVSFDTSVTQEEQTEMRLILDENQGLITDSITLAVETTETPGRDYQILNAYVPVTTFNSTRQKITTTEIASIPVFIPDNTDSLIQSSLSTLLGVDVQKSTDTDGSLDLLTDDSVAFIPIKMLNPSMKLLVFNEAYYLDTPNAGAIFRTVSVTSNNQATEGIENLVFTSLKNKDAFYKVNMTGVTALTRVMQRKLSQVGDPTYFSAKIGDFLSDADLTHVSNEVSFKPNCEYSNTSFCSPPEFIETLKASGVDLVELTGNHNNDTGNIYNTESIKLYNSLGINTFGGGLNEIEAAKTYIADSKGSKIAFIGYNLADGLGSGAIAGATTAGANYYTDAKAEADIAAAKLTSDFIIVDIQYSECQAYPEGFVEFPQCDGTIGGQEEAFRKMVDLGADMVIGSSAHQPQTYEMYKGKPIYYGLGNLYFEQTQWPGTERGIILTHYFSDGKLLQTKLTPTVYDRDFQTRIMTDSEADYLLTRLYNAR